jgi:hypothetical protein
MKQLNKIVFVLGFLALPVCGFAEIQCPIAGGEGSLEKTVALIKASKSCYEADQLATACGWGSSADTQIAGAAGDICAKDFRGKLTRIDRQIYLTLINKCPTKYALMQGTMYIGAEAFCEESIGKLFSDLYLPAE